MSLDEDSVLLEQFIQQRKHRTGSDSPVYSQETQRSYRTAGQAFLLWLSKEEISLAGLDQKILEKWKKSLNGALISRVHAVTVVRSFVKYASKHTPCPRLTVPQFKKVVPPRHYLSSEEIEHSIKEVRSKLHPERREAVIYTTLGFGLKTSELSDLTREQLTETNEHPEEFSLLSDSEWCFFQYLPTQPSRPEKKRIIPVRTGFAKQYTEYMAKLSQDQTYVFSRILNCNHIGGRGMRRLIEESKICLQDLRNTYIFDLICKGLNGKAIAKAAGITLLSAQECIKQLKSSRKNTARV